MDLTVANHVVLMDLWWNPTVEEHVGSYRGCRVLPWEVALGVNLTVANHVVRMDLWWNPTVEEQVGGSYRG